MEVLHPVQHAPVLDVGTGANLDPVHVAPQDNIHPNTAFCADLDVADDLGALVDERGLGDPGRSGGVRP